MKQDFNTVFKAPKYTGVTLSLLSMFVLAAMFVVWQKFPQNQKPESNTKISVICDMKLRVPSINIISSFEKEYSCNINIKFLNSDEIHKLNSNMIDMLIFNESDLAKIAGFNSKHISIIPFAFEKPFGSDNKNNRQPFSCLIKGHLSISVCVCTCPILFCTQSRSILPCRSRFPGVDGDQWKLRPSISIMVENNYEREISKFAKIFSDREGITLEVSSKNLKKQMQL